LYYKTNADIIAYMLYVCDIVLLIVQMCLAHFP